MPSYVLADKCDGCKALDKTACQYICPNDLMVLDEKQGKAFNQDPEMCWECYSCVKICPQQAIEVRGYADFIPLGANVTPLRSSDSIMWTFDHYTTGDDDLKSQTLMCEPEGLNTERGKVKMDKVLTL
jgi:adenylylsulfate reductase subunit B